MSELKRILLPTKFDEASTAASHAAAVLARTTGGSVHVLSVLEALMYGSPEMAAWAERDPRTHPRVTVELRETLESLRAEGVAEVDSEVAYGIATDVILERANEGRFDLLVVGKPEGGGRVGSYLVARAKIPVLAVPSVAPVVEKRAPAPRSAV